jgi:hypothetical protein
VRSVGESVSKSTFSELYPKASATGIQRASPSRGQVRPEAGPSRGKVLPEGRH